MQVLIRTTNLRTVTSKKTGVQYFLQTAALDNGTDFPSPFDVFLDDPKKAYAPGSYTFGPDAIYVDKQGRLAVSPRLVPVAKPAAKAA